MLFRPNQPEAMPLRPRVTPDPERAAELLRRMEAIRYQPQTGFHRDRLQSKASRPGLYLVK